RRAWLIGAAGLLALVLAWVAMSWALGPSTDTSPEEDTSSAANRRPFVPAGFENLGDERGAWPGSERYFKVLRRTKAGQVFEFVLIPGYRNREHGITLTPFYLLRGKVTVAQFRAAARAPAYP